MNKWLFENDLQLLDCRLNQESSESILHILLIILILTSVDFTIFETHFNIITLVHVILDNYFLQYMNNDYIHEVIEQ